MQNPGRPSENMARAPPVVAVEAGVLCPWPSSSATAGLAKRSIPTAEGMMSASTARRPPVIRCRKASRWPVDHFSDRSGVTTDITVTAMMP